MTAPCNITSRAVLALFVLAALAGVSRAGEPEPSQEWMAHCAKNLAGEGLPEKVVRKYCACMDGIIGEAGMRKLDQGQIERSWPPAHVVCHLEARKP